MIITKGSTDVRVRIRIVDSGDGTPETGVTSATSGLDLKYQRSGSAVVNITESDLSTLTDAHSDGGMLHIGAGYYRLDVPDAAFASGVDNVLIFGTVTGMVVIGELVELVAYNPQSATSLGLSNLDGTVSSRASQTSVDTIDDFLDTEVAAIKAKTDNLPSDPADASDIAATLATIAGYIDTEVATIITNLATVAGYIDTEVAAIKAKTDNLPSDPADASDVAAAIATLQAFVDTEVASILAAVDTEVAAIKAKTDSLTFTVAGQVDANIQAVNDTSLLGNGSTTPWGPV